MSGKSKEKLRKRPIGPVVVSVINLKGGVGKTTITTLLAREIAKRLFNVLAVDLDPQSNLSQALMTEYEYKEFMKNKEPSIVELLDGTRPPNKARPGPSLTSESDVVRDIDGARKLELIPSRFDFSDRLISSVGEGNTNSLARFIAKHKQDRDIVMIDCAPTESIITRTAYHASRHILLPVRPEFFSTIGFPLLNESLEGFRRNNRGHFISVCGVLINNPHTPGAPPSPHTRMARKEIREHAKRYGWPVMKKMMYHSRGYPKLMRNEFPSHPGNALDLLPAIVDEFLGMVGLDTFNF